MPAIILLILAIILVPIIIKLNRAPLLPSHSIPTRSHIRGRTESMPRKHAVGAERTLGLCTADWVDLLSFGVEEDVVTE